MFNTDQTEQTAVEEPLFPYVPPQQCPPFVDPHPDVSAAADDLVGEVDGLDAIVLLLADIAISQRILSGRGAL